MNRLESLARGLLKPINPYLSVLLGLLTFMWGLWILSPFWDVFNRAPVYSKALEFAPEWAWGTWATLCGMSILYGIYLGSFRWLVFSLGFGVWHWFTVSGMLWWGDWQNTAGLTYMFIAIYTASAYLNIKVNYVKPGVHKNF